MGAAVSVTFASLSPPRRRLVEMMRFVDFGRIENLRVSKGQPDFAAPPLVIRTVKVGANPEAGTHPQRGRRARLDRENFYLQPAVTDLLQQFARIGDGVVTRIEVAHGTPLFFEVAEQHGGETPR